MNVARQKMIGEKCYYDKGNKKLNGGNIKSQEISFSGPGCRWKKLLFLAQKHI